MAKKKLRSDALCVDTVVTDADNGIVNGDVMVKQRVLITIETVLGYLQMHRRAEECDAAASRRYKMTHSVVDTLIVVDNNT